MYFCRVYTLTLHQVHKINPTYSSVHTSELSPGGFVQHLFFHSFEKLALRELDQVRLHLFSALTFLLWRNAMAVSVCSARRRGSTTAVLAVRVSVRPAPPAACLCPRGAGAGTLCGFVTPATSTEAHHKPSRVRIQASYTDFRGRLSSIKSSQCSTISNATLLDGALQ